MEISLDMVWECYMELKMAYDAPAAQPWIIINSLTYWEEQIEGYYFLEEDELWELLDKYIEVSEADWMHHDIEYLRVIYEEAFDMIRTKCENKRYKVLSEPRVKGIKKSES